MTMNRFVALAVAGLAFAVAAASAQSVENRQYNMQRRIAESIEHGRVSPDDASRLERDMDKVSRHIADKRRDHRGRLSAHDWDKLNRELDKVEEHLREAQRYARYDDRRDRRNERDGFYDRGQRPW
jgi:septal ring factor EnvC (AmiA/AmiB activator)